MFSSKFTGRLNDGAFCAALRVVLAPMRIRRSAHSFASVLGMLACGSAGVVFADQERYSYLLEASLGDDALYCYQTPLLEEVKQ